MRNTLVKEKANLNQVSINTTQL